MATDKRGHCPKCGRSYSSWTHRRDCRGMTRAEHRAKNRGHIHISRACSAPDWGRILAPRGPVADGAFYDRPQEQQEPTRAA